MLGDRILAVGDLSAIADGEVATVLDVAGRVVAPGFIDPHGHSDGSLLVDGALASHLHQGYTTQLSGNCGETLAPIDDRGPRAGRAGAAPERPDRALADVRASTSTRSSDGPLGPNVAFLVGSRHGPRLGAWAARRARRPRRAGRRWSREVEAALDAGAIGLSTGLIYAPGMHADAAELEALVAATAARRRALRDPHAQRGRRAVRVARRVDRHGPARAARPGRLQVSHLKCGSRAVWGRAGEAVARLEAARADGLDVAADQYPYTAAADDPRDDPAARAPGPRGR